MGTGFFGQGGDLLQAFGQGFFSTPGLKDYEHAAKTFETNGYQLSPRLKFLYHVFFNINTGQIPQLQAAYGSGTVETIGMMVKSIDLPKYKIDTTVMNQYNRKRVIQSKIRYEPSRIELHDDQSDLIRNMWYNYYTYYYKDPSQKYQSVPNTSGTLGMLQSMSNGFNYNANDIYSQTLQSADWGFIGESYSDGTNTGTNSSGKPPFFRDITIYGFSQKKYASYVLINPIISQWNSDRYDYSEGGGTMKNDVTIEYETVKYYSGAIGSQKPSSKVAGFADPAHYDIVSSGISRPGSTQSVFGQGGLLDAVGGTVQDLEALASGQGGLQNVIGAVQAANGAYKILNNRNFNQGLQAELKKGGVQVARQLTGAGINAANGKVFPRAPLIPANTPIR
jgi:hypothetical protein